MSRKSRQKNHRKRQKKAQRQAQLPLTGAPARLSAAEPGREPPAGRGLLSSAVLPSEPHHDVYAQDGTLTGQAWRQQQDQTGSALALRQAGLDFGGGAGVFDLSFCLPHGAILGMIGPSGCGKTTTMRLLNGIYRPTRGEVCVLGKAPHRFSPAEKAAIGYIPQQFILYPNLSVEENLHFMGGIYSMPLPERRRAIQRLLEFIEMEDARNRLGRQLSGGMKRRLMLAGALLHDPQLIFADEPTAGIDPILRARIWDNFRALRRQGRTLLVTTQYVGEAAYCDLVAVMRKGRLVTLDTPAGLRRQAMGGDVIHIEVESRQVFPAMALLEGLPGVSRVSRVRAGPGHANGLAAGSLDGDLPDDLPGATPAIEATGRGIPTGRLNVPPGRHDDWNAANWHDSPAGSELLSVVVDHAGKQAPRLLGRLRAELEITPLSAEQYIPAFDEVFVRLIQRQEAGG
ncbi:MAG: ABC transporter ATP-binding protein [Chloroflexota bacterium]